MESMHKVGQVATELQPSPAPPRATAQKLCTLSSWISPEAPLHNVTDHATDNWRLTPAPSPSVLLKVRGEAASSHPIITSPILQGFPQST